jgi:hypothetical protein
LPWLKRAGTGFGLFYLSKRMTILRRGKLEV